MANDEMVNAKIEATAMMCKSIYTDFMPIVQQIKSHAGSIKINKQNTAALNNILEQVEHAESLLNQLKKFYEGHEANK
jgi:hypothetical protein